MNTIRVKEIIGKTVYAAQENKPILTVKDVVYDPDTNSLTAFIAEQRRLISPRMFVVPFREVKEMYLNAVVIDSRYKVHKVSDTLAHSQYLASNNFFLFRMPVHDSDDTKLGILTDLIFQASDGKIVGIEISPEGRFMRASKNPFLIQPDRMKIGQQKLTVYQGSPQKGLATTQPSNGTPEYHAEIQQTVPKYDEKVHTIINKVKHEHNLTFPEVKEYKKTIEGYQVEQLVGKRLVKNVQLPNNNIFAQAGEIITPEMIQEARRLNVLQSLIAHARNIPEPIATPRYTAFQN